MSNFKRIPTYADEAAFPRDQINARDGSALLPAQCGLTRREYFAAMAMQGIMACADQPRHIATVAQDAVRLADALLTELENPR